MDAGLLRHKIRIQSLGTEKNEFGEPAEVWEDVTTVRASINPLSGREFIAARQEQSSVTHKVTIRYNPAVKASMRVLYNGRVLDILHIVDTFERHSEMVLMCKERIGCL